MGTGESADAARRRLLDWLADTGSRWGLPSAPCRVHGQLYLTARPASGQELAEATALSEADVEAALEWLRQESLIEEEPTGRWRTMSDPWDVVSQALESRRARELGPALALLRDSRRDAAGDPVLSRQVRRLLDLVEDIAAIDAQARRLSPATMRTLLGAGGRLARLFGGSGR
jgi:DNA-binding transcriptional regulator GbsR (MarR family)